MLREGYECAIQVDLKQQNNILEHTKHDINTATNIKGIVCEVVPLYCVQLYSVNSVWGLDTRQILSRRQCAPNKLCALNKDVRLITHSTVDCWMLLSNQVLNLKNKMDEGDYGVWDRVAGGTI